MKESKKIKKYLEQLVKVYRKFSVDTEDEGEGGDANIENLATEQIHSILDSADVMLEDSMASSVADVTNYMELAHEAGKAGLELYSYANVGGGAHGEDGILDDQCTYVWEAKSEDALLDKFKKLLTPLSKKLLK